MKKISFVLLYIYLYHLEKAIDQKTDSFFQLAASKIDKAT